ncbi:MAG: hypothetical protein ABI351_02430 [Herbaspirillum sp.]
MTSIIRSRLFLASVFVLLLLALLTSFNHQKPRVLFLHSFSEEGVWEQAVDDGIRRELAKNRTPIASRWHYLSYADQDGTINWRAAASRARHAIDAYQPDVLVMIGEEAQQYVGRQYVNHPSLRLVYAMGEDPALFGYVGVNNVTGVRETLPLAPLLELLQNLKRPTLRVRVLGMDDATGQAERQQVQNFSWGAHQLLGVELVKDYPSWQAAVRRANLDADVLLVLSFTGLPRSASDPRPKEAAAISHWTEYASKPLVIGVRDSFVTGGGALAVVPSPEGLGQQVAHQALLALAGTRRGGALPPPTESVDFQISMRPERLAARKVVLPVLYVQAARAAHSLYLRGQ